jgi:hypothetical protein
MIPKPLARVRVAYGHPFEVAEGEEGFAEGVARASASLDEISRKDPWHGEAIAIA